MANVHPGRNKGNGTGESIYGTSVVHGEAEALILGTVTEFELATISRLSDPTATTSTVQRYKNIAGLEN